MGAGPAGWANLNIGKANLRSAQITLASAHKDAQHVSNTCMQACRIVNARRQTSCGAQKLGDVKPLENVNQEHRHETQARHYLQCAPYKQRPECQYLQTGLLSVAGFC